MKKKRVHSKKKIIKGIKKKSKEENKEEKKPEGYLRTGMKGFDNLFEKGYGIPNSAAVLIEGGPGSGKTNFCLATINGLCKQGKKCLYMSFEESEDQLISHMKHFNWKVDEFIKKGLL